MAVLGALALVLAGPGAPGQAAVVAPTALTSVITLPGTALGAVGATAPGITTAAVTASSTGAGMNIAATGVAGGASAAGAAAPVAGPALAIAGAFVVGYGIGTFACGYIPACASDEVDQTNPAYVVNSDQPPDPAGFSPGPSGTVTYTGAGNVADGSIAIGLTMTAAPAFRAAPAQSTYNIRIDWSDPWAQANVTGSATVYQERRVYCANGPSAGATVTLNGTASGNISLNTDTPSGYVGSASSTFSGTCSAGTYFDRVNVKTYTKSFPLSGLVEHTWYPVGHLSRPPGPTDPARHWITKGQCVKGAVLQNVNSPVSRTFHEGTDSTLPKYPDVSCPAGFGLIGLQVHKITPSSTGDEVVWEWTPDPATDPWATIPKLYPECAGGACVLRLWRLLDGSRVDCFDVPGACRGWYADAAKAANYECTYGSHVMTLADCDVYRPTFDVLVETEGGPKTETSPDTGLGTDPGTHANPDGSLPDPTPGTDPGGARECPPDAGFLSFLNPFWLFDTLKCAFVPTVPGLQAGWANAEVDWCATGPGALLCAAEGIFAPFLTLGTGIDPDDCLGADIPLLDIRPGHADTVMNPFQACDPPASTISDLWLGVSSGVVYIGAFLTGAQMLARTIGAEDGVPA